MRCTVRDFLNSFCPCGLAATALVLAACGGSEPPIATEIALDRTALAFSALGQTEQLSATVLDETGATLQDVAISWSSSSNAVVTVTSNGTVTAVGIGSAQVTATAGAADAVVEITVAQTPTQLQKVLGDGQTGTVGQPLPVPLTVELRDANGNPVPGATVNFTVTQGAGTVASSSEITDLNGRASTTYTMGLTAGPNHQISALSEAASISAVFLQTGVAGPAALVQVQAGDGQTAAPVATTATPPAVVVKDAFGNPVSGITVVFTIGSGGGSLTGGTTTTNANGIAQVGSWTLGSAGANTLIATVRADNVTGNPLTFTATAAAAGAFNIQLRFFGSATPAQEQAFRDAEARWESIIVGDLSNVALAAPAGTCGGNSPEVNEIVDDLLILATVEEIDGPRGTLAQAGPCYFRTFGGLPVLGLVRFDAADLDDIESAGVLFDVILHEMGHVLGIGTMWDLQDLLADPSLQGGTDPHFTGADAVEAFDAVGGTTYNSGQKVPVENTGGAGTADAHWRESVMRNELMTGFVSFGTSSSLNPLSIVTIGSLADQGYSVTSSPADPYSLSASLRETAPTSVIRLGDDRLLLPLRRVDSSGRVTQVIPR